jgi:hypothetical protein
MFCERLQEWTTSWKGSIYTYACHISGTATSTVGLMAKPMLSTFIERYLGTPVKTWCIVEVGRCDQWSWHMARWINSKNLEADPRVLASDPFTPV